MAERAQPSVATLAEAGTVVLICFGLFALWSAGARGIASDAAFIELILVECGLGAVTLSFLHRRGHPVRALLPAPSAWGSLLGAALCAACLGAWHLVSPLLAAAPAVAPAVGAPGVAPALAMIVLASAVNGLYEETFLLGYLVRALSPFGASLALGLSLLVRLLVHAGQGPAGALAAVVFGLVVGAFYWRTRRLWPVVVAHALQDVIAFSYSG